MKSLAAVSWMCVLLSVVAADGGLYLDPPMLDIIDQNAGAFVKGCLRSAPKQKTYVFLEGANFGFDKCYLTFDQNNWNVPQTIKFVANPYATVAEQQRKIPITMKIWSPQASYHDTSVSYMVNRGQGAAGHCYALGDPHFSTFDMNHDSYYHYQREGTFYLVQSKIFTVQAYFQKCNAKGTCMTKMAVRYGESIFILDGSSEGNSVLQRVTNFQGIQVSHMQSGSQQTYHFTFSCGSTLRVRINKLWKDGNLRYFDTFIKLATTYQKNVNGLCGAYDGNATNDFRGSDGTVYNHETCLSTSKDDMFTTNQSSDLYKFGESWVVPQADNVLLCGAKCAQNNNYIIRDNITACRIPEFTTQQPFNPEVSIVPFVPNGFNIFNVDTCPQYTTVGRLEPIPFPDIVIPNDVIETAVKGCYNFVAYAGCEGLVDVSFFQKLCEFDVRAGLNAQASFSSYYSQYRTHCSSVVQSKCLEPFDQIRNQFTTILQANGFGYSGCGQSCGTSASCCDIGCVCNNPGQIYVNGQCVFAVNSLPDQYYPIPSIIQKVTNVGQALAVAIRDSYTVQSKIVYAAAETDAKSASSSTLIQFPDGVSAAETTGASIAALSVAIAAAVVFNLI